MARFGTDAHRTDFPRLHLSPHFAVRLSDVDVGALDETHFTRAAPHCWRVVSSALCQITRPGIAAQRNPQPRTDPPEISWRFHADAGD